MLSQAHACLSQPLFFTAFQFGISCLENANTDDLELEEQGSSEPESTSSDFQAPTIKSYDESLARGRWQALFSVHQIPVLLVALITALNGLVGIIEPLCERLVQHPRIFEIVVPYGVYHWSRSLGVLFGFMLLFLAMNLVQRKRVSWFVAQFILVISLIVHLVRARIESKSDSDFTLQSLIFAVAPILLNIALLWIYRKNFSVRSEIRKIRTGALFVAGTLLSALIYGTAGFFLLDPKDFGINFQFSDALIRTLREFSLIGNPDLTPHTRQAAWFLDSLRLSGCIAGVFALYSLFRPIEYQLRTKPAERKLCEEILDKHGKDALDHYKVLSDKSYIFSGDRDALVAYKTELGVAVALGDVVGKDESLPAFLKAYVAWCHENGWMVSFMQTGERHLDLYKERSLDVLKVGEDAVVHLDKFASETIKKKDFKNRVKKFEKDGFSFELLKPPHSEDTLDKLQVVSNAWLSLPGRRERCFSLGMFDRQELKNENVYAVFAKDKSIIAFVNQVRSYADGEASIDLMRHQHEVPNGTMDYLFVKLLLALHTAGYKKFNLGLAALSGVGESAEANMHEKAVHQIYEHMNRFFSYKGLRRYKDKFDPTWESRYLIYEGGTPGLLKTALAILQVSEP